MSKRTKRLRKGPEGWEFVIAEKHYPQLQTDIVVTQRDLRELQKAKAAIHTGIQLLMKKMSLTEEDISCMVIAGAFGNNINPKNARMIGLYPEISLERIDFMGNLAGIGAQLTLLSKELREYTEEISKRVNYYELTSDPEFYYEYINSLVLPHANMKMYPITSNLLRKLGLFP
jgi:uncharacterized 2Fe-2S/4Fe-4S cluster protein (DUF4445 family)